MAILKSINDGGQIEITVLEELLEFNNDVTDHPVEDGSSISDHAALRPGEIPLSGVVAGEDAPGKIATLRRWRTERHLLKYTGRNILTNYVIQECRTEHDVTVRDGFRFRLVLKQVRIVKPAVVELVKSDPVVAAPVAGAQAVSTQVKPEEPKGRQQVQHATRPEGIPEGAVPRLTEQLIPPGSNYWARVYDRPLAPPGVM